jgi:hypothetical protein
VRGLDQQQKWIPESGSHGLMPSFELYEKRFDLRPALAVLRSKIPIRESACEMR